RDEEVARLQLREKELVALLRSKEHEIEVQRSRCNQFVTLLKKLTDQFTGVTPSSSNPPAPGPTIHQFPVRVVTAEHSVPAPTDGLASLQEVMQAPHWTRSTNSLRGVPDQRS
ncbi:hypothetical protein EJB05_21800, partial [Eragrostis curvula]